MTGVYSPNTSRAELKAFGEDAAARFLEERGMAILERNWRVRAGEIDIIAVEGRDLVFVEVKARRPGAILGPEESVTPTKQRKLRTLAEIFLASRAATRIEYEECRFDVVAVIQSSRPHRGGNPHIDYIPNAF